MAVILCYFARLPAYYYSPLFFLSVCQLSKILLFTPDCRFPTGLDLAEVAVV